MADAAVGATAGAADVLPRAGIHLGLASTDREAAVALAGAALVELGAVDDGYPAAMAEREAMVSSYIGEGVAIPHGTDAGRALVRRTCLAVLQFPEGIDWEGQDCRVAIAIAASADEHMAVMSRLAQVLMDPAAAERLRTTDDPDEVRALLAPDGG